MTTDILTNHSNLIMLAILLTGIALAHRVIKALCAIGAVLLAIGYFNGTLPW